MVYSTQRPRGRRKESREGVGLATEQAKAQVSPHFSLNQAISAALRSAQAEQGGKVLAGHFDGLGGSEVSESTISRWIYRPASFNPDHLSVLIGLRPELGRWLLRAIPVWLGTLEGVLSGLDDDTASKVRDAYQAAVFDEVAPGKWGRR